LTPFLHQVFHLHGATEVESAIAFIDGLNETVTDVADRTALYRPFGGRSFTGVDGWCGLRGGGGCFLFDLYHYCMILYLEILKIRKKISPTCFLLVFVDRAFFGTGQENSDHNVPALSGGINQNWASIRPLD